MLIRACRLSLVTSAAFLVAVPSFGQTVEVSRSDNGRPGQSASPGSGAAAQNGGENRGLEDIVVTARKVSENLQTVPVAVTAFSGAALQQQSAVTVADTAKLTPGLIIREGAASAVASTFELRGQYQNDTLASLDPSVGVYVDGLYWARAYGINSDLLDIQSVQTLKGPQGTLFGRNTTGGAILIQTNDPNLSDFSGLLSGTYGRYNAFSGTAIANVPFVEDKVGARVAVERNSRDGYIHEPSSDTDLVNKDDWTARAKLLLKPTDNLSILLAGELYRSKTYNQPYRTLFIDPAAEANLEAGAETLGPTCFADFAACQAAGYAAVEKAIAQNSKGNTVDIDVLPRSLTKTQTYSATVSLDTFFGNLKFVTGYRKEKVNEYKDIDGTQYGILDFQGIQNLKQYSAELQATGKVFDGAVTFATGLFYFHESGLDFNGADAFYDVLNQSNPNIFDGRIHNDSFGAYGQATWRITDKLSFTGGLRYSLDDKGIVLNNRAYVAALGTFACTIAACPSRRRDSFDGVSYTAGFDYRLTPSVLLYVKTARGFRSGGENLRALGGTSAFVPFKPEIATSYEAGVKSEFFDRRVRLNVAGYYTQVKDIQRTTIVATPLAAATIVSNAGRANIGGGEAELDALVVDGFRLGGTVAYTDPKYKKYIDPETGFDRSHERFDNVPRWTYTVSGTFTHDFDFGKFTLRGDWIWQGTTPLQPFNYYVDPAGVYRNATDGTAMDPAVAKGIKAATTLRAVGLVNARASLSFADDRYEVAVFGRNLTNKQDVDVSTLFPAPFGIVAGYRREPRTWGVTATVKFGHF